MSVILGGIPKLLVLDAGAQYINAAYQNGNVIFGTTVNYWIDFIPDGFRIQYRGSYSPSVTYYATL